MRCRVCHRETFAEPLLRYSDMPGVAQNFPTESELAADESVEIILCQCSGCGLVQLDSEPVSYFRDVLRSAAFSKEMGDFRRVQLGKIVDKYGLRGKKVLEVGCGRGEYLSLLHEVGANAFGIENADDSVRGCVSKNLQVTKGYVEDAELRIASSPFDAFFTFNFLEHIPDPNTFLQGIANNLSSEGLGLVEVPNFDMILKERMASELMRDHLLYFTRATLESTLKLNGFDVLECEELWHSYILSAVVRKRARLNLSSFDAHTKKIQTQIESYLETLGSRPAVVWGAGHQSLAMLAMTGVKDKIKYLVDSAPFKQGRFTPSTHIPIHAPDNLKNDSSIGGVIVMGASYSNEIVRTLEGGFRKDLSIAVLRPDGIETVR